MPKLSIITINLNNLTGLQKTMQSVFDQTFTDYEYIIIDGGSTDSSKEYIEEYAVKLAYWMSEEDGGVFQAMNKGLAMATGEYVYFLNSGDYFYNQNVLEKIVPQLETEDIYYGDMVTEDNRGERREFNYPTRLELSFFISGSLAHPTIFTKRSLLVEYYGYREDLRIVSDWDFYTKRILVSKSTYRHLNCFIVVFNTDGISSDKKFEELKNKELNQVKSEIYPSEVWAALSLLKDELQFYRSHYHGLSNSGMVKLALKAISLKRGILAKLKLRE